MEAVKVNPKEIPDADYDVGCSILATSVRRFFEQPGVQEEFEKWKQTEEGKRAAFPSKKRSATKTVT